MRSFYSPLSISALFYGYLKLLATPKGKESKQGCEIQELNSGPLAPRPRTNRSLPGDNGLECFKSQNMVVEINPSLDQNYVTETRCIAQVDYVGNMR